MKLKLFNVCLVLMGLLLIKPVLGNDPPLNDGNCHGQNCDSANAGGRDYFLKLKYLERTDSQVSVSDFHRIRDSRYQVSSEKFCAIAYSCEEGKGCDKRGNRTMHGYRMNFTGPTEDSSFVLSNGDSTIPVTLKLLGVAGDGTEGINEYLYDNEYVEVDGNGSDKFCRENEFVVVAEIDTNDLKNANDGLYTGRFDVKIGSVASPSAPQSLSAQDDLDINLMLPPFILISGLEDMTLVDTNSSDISATQDFCVHVSGQDKFKIKGESEEGKGSFQLSNGTAANNIDYGVTIGRVKGGDGNSKKLVDEGVYYSHSSWNGAKELFCESGENMKLTLDIKESDITAKPSGVYKDTLYLTVEPTE